jgi:hypothetical protein
MDTSCARRCRVVAGPDLRAWELSVATLMLAGFGLILVVVGMPGLADRIAPDPATLAPTAETFRPAHPPTPTARLGRSTALAVQRVRRGYQHTPRPHAVARLALPTPPLPRANSDDRIGRALFAATPESADMEFTWIGEGPDPHAPSHAGDLRWDLMEMSGAQHREWRLRCPCPMYTRDDPAGSPRQRIASSQQPTANSQQPIDSSPRQE